MKRKNCVLFESKTFPPPPIVVKVKKNQIRNGVNNAANSWVPGYRKRQAFFTFKPNRISLSKLFIGMSELLTNFWKKICHKNHLPSQSNGKLNFKFAYLQASFEIEKNRSSSGFVCLTWTQIGLNLMFRLCLREKKTTLKLTRAKSFTWSIFFKWDRTTELWEEVFRFLEVTFSKTWLNHKMSEKWLWQKLVKEEFDQKLFLAKISLRQ